MFRPACRRRVPRIGAEGFERMVFSVRSTGTGEKWGILFVHAKPGKKTVPKGKGALNGGHQHFNDNPWR